MRGIDLDCGADDPGHQRIGLEHLFESLAVVTVDVFGDALVGTDLLADRTGVVARGQGACSLAAHHPDPLHIGRQAPGHTVNQHVRLDPGIEREITALRQSRDEIEQPFHLRGMPGEALLRRERLAVLLQCAPSVAQCRPALTKPELAAGPVEIGIEFRDGLARAGTGVAHRLARAGIAIEQPVHVAAMALHLHRKLDRRPDGLRADALLAHELHFPAEQRHEERQCHQCRQQAHRSEQQHALSQVQAIHHRGDGRKHPFRHARRQRPDARFGFACHFHLHSLRGGETVHPWAAGAMPETSQGIAPPEP